MNRRTQNDLMLRLRSDADRICHRFGLRYRSIEPERANVKRRYGICYDDGSIKIRLRHASTGEALKYSSLVNTLCHELAHLKHFNHGPQFKAFYARILAWARYEGIYRPGPMPGPLIERRVEWPPRGRRDGAPGSAHGSRVGSPGSAHGSRVGATGSAHGSRGGATGSPPPPRPVAPELPMFGSARTVVSSSRPPAPRRRSGASPRRAPSAGGPLQLDLFV